jgi:hypothetical protein
MKVSKGSGSRYKTNAWKQRWLHFVYAKDIHYEFVPKEQTANGKLYEEAIKRLIV